MTGLTTGGLLAMASPNGAAGGAQPGGGAGMLGMIGYMLIFFALFYFLMIRPQMRREVPGERQQITPMAVACKKRRKRRAAPTAQRLLQFAQPETNRRHIAYGGDIGQNQFIDCIHACPLS